MTNAPMTRDQQRIAQLEYQLRSLRKDLAMFALLGFAIVPNVLGLVGFDLDYSMRLVASIVLALAFVYVRRWVLDVRQTRSDVLQRQQEFIESVPELTKNP